jgi:hypothetical protein
MLICKKRLEVAAGLEPAKTGFADQRLGLFGIATSNFIPTTYTQICTQTALSTPIYRSFSLRNLLKPIERLLRQVFADPCLTTRRPRPGRCYRERQLRGLIRLKRTSGPSNAATTSGRGLDGALPLCTQQEPEHAGLKARRYTALWYAGTASREAAFRFTMGAPTTNRKPINQAFWRWVRTSIRLNSIR